MFSFWKSSPAPVQPVQPVQSMQKEEKKVLFSDKPIEHCDDFKIVMILDESGSMGSIRNDMITAINDLIMEQKQIKDKPCKFTLVKFNDSIKRVIQNRDLQEVSELTPQDYIPDRTTALYDAIGSTVNWFRYESNVLMVIVTDGQENSSKEYNHAQIKQMLDEKQKHRGWTYVYLSNDLSTARQGDNLGLKTGVYSTNCTQTKSKFGNYVGKTMNSAISNYRKHGTSVQAQLNSNNSWVSVKKTTI